MAIVLNDRDWEELYATAQAQGESLYQQTTSGIWVSLPQRLGSGGEQTIALRNGLSFDIRDGKLRQELHWERHHESHFPLVSKFLLAGRSRVRTANVPNVADDYEEVTGCHYLYCLPDLVEVEEWQAEKPIQLVMLCANLDYFKQYALNDPELPQPLKQLLEMDAVQPFHQALGKITPVMMQVLGQILNCPYQGLMQKLYLEGKALELLTLQFTEWADLSLDATSPILLRTDDIDRLHSAQAILIQRATNPPSLTQLARQVGLNDRKLKQGFLQVFGTTVFGYLHDYRMERSRQLLTSGEMSVTEVAHLVGYASLPSFSKAFRKKFGNSPITYATGQNSKKVRLG